MAGGSGSIGLGRLHSGARFDRRFEGPDVRARTGWPRVTFEVLPRRGRGIRPIDRGGIRPQMEIARGGVREQIPGRRRPRMMVQASLDPPAFERQDMVAVVG